MSDDDLKFGVAFTPDHPLNRRGKSWFNTALLFSDIHLAQPHVEKIRSFDFWVDEAASFTERQWQAFEALGIKKAVEDAQHRGYPPFANFWYASGRVVASALHQPHGVASLDYGKLEQALNALWDKVKLPEMIYGQGMSDVLRQVGLVKKMKPKQKLPRLVAATEMASYYDLYLWTERNLLL